MYSRMKIKKVSVEKAKQAKQIELKPESNNGQYNVLIKCIS